MSRLMNSYEYTVSQAVTVTAGYNPYEQNTGAGTQDGLGFQTWTAFDTAYGTASGTAPWSGLSSEPIKDVTALKRAVANQIGIRPNSMVLGTAVFDQLLTNKDILDRIRYTTADSVDTDVLARYFGLERGLRVAEGRYLANDGKLKPVFPENGILLFYSHHASWRCQRCNSCI
jgi:Phage major capsid protein E